MKIETNSGITINNKLVGNYFDSLVGMFFKILPLYEKREKSLRIYMENFRDELEGCKRIITAIDCDPMFMSLFVTLQSLIDLLDKDDCEVSKFRQKVFGAISVCKKLSLKYGGETSE